MSDMSSMPRYGSTANTEGLRMDNATTAIPSQYFNGNPNSSGVVYNTGYNYDINNGVSRPKQKTSPHKLEDIKTVEHNGFIIKYEDNNGKVADYLDIFKQIADKYKLNVTVYNPHGDKTGLPYPTYLIDGSDKKTLYIANYAKAVVSHQDDRKELMKTISELLNDGREIKLKILGKEIKLEEWQSDSWVYEKGISKEFCIYDELAINRLATVDANKIFIGFDLMHSSSQESKEIFNYIVMASMGVIEENEAELFGDFAVESYVKYCNKAFQRMVETKRKEVKNINYSIRSIEKDIFRLERKKLDLFNELRNLDENKVKEEKKKEYEEIVGMITLGMYKEFKIKNGVMYGYTHEITVNYKNRDYKLGEFEVTIGGDNGDLKINNLTNKRKGFNHPHVNREGHCCLGNISADVRKMIGAEQYLSAFQMLYNFLASYDDSNPYTKIDLWDVDWDGKTVISAEMTLEEVDRDMEEGDRENPRPTPETASIGIDRASGSDVTISDGGNLSISGSVGVSNININGDTHGLTITGPNSGGGVSLTPGVQVQGMGTEERGTDMNRFVGRPITSETLRAVRDDLDRSASLRGWQTSVAFEDEAGEEIRRVVENFESESENLGPRMEDPRL